MSIFQFTVSKFSIPQEYMEQLQNYTTELHYRSTNSILRFTLQTKGKIIKYGNVLQLGQALLLKLLLTLALHSS